MAPTSSGRKTPSPLRSSSRCSHQGTGSMSCSESSGSTRNYGVEEYYIYNPDNGDLLDWRRGDGGLEEITEMNGHVSQRLGIRFEPGEGPNNLRILGPDGQRFLTHQELMEQVEAERQRAERLAARLRELGIEPD